MRIVIAAHKASILKHCLYEKQSFSKKHSISLEMLHFDLNMQHNEAFPLEMLRNAASPLEMLHF
jgi:hypothetical protein